MAREQIWSYPAIVAAIGQARLPTFGEMRFLMRRISRETRTVPDDSRRRKIIRDLAGAIVQGQEASGGA